MCWNFSCYLVCYHRHFWDLWTKAWQYQQQLKCHMISLKRKWSNIKYNFCLFFHYLLNLLLHLLSISDKRSFNLLRRYKNIQQIFERFTLLLTRLEINKWSAQQKIVDIIVLQPNTHFLFAESLALYQLSILFCCERLLLSITLSLWSNNACVTRARVSPVSQVSRYPYLVSDRDPVSPSAGPRQQLSVHSSHWACLIAN